MRARQRLSALSMALSGLLIPFLSALPSRCGGPGAPGPPGHLARMRTSPEPLRATMVPAASGSLLISERSLPSVLLAVTA